MNKVLCAFVPKQLSSKIHDLLLSDKIDASDKVIGYALSHLLSNDGIEITEENYKDHLISIKRYINSRKEHLLFELEVKKLRLKLRKENIDILVSSTGYKKGDPQRHPDVDYVFTENAEAYIASHTFPLEEEPDIEFPYKGRTKLNVSDVKGTNQAGIRTDKEGNISPNAYGIVVKKYLQDVNGKFVAKDGQFQDTDEDFKLFVSLNEDMFNRLIKSSNKEVVFPAQMGLGKAALPKRFAEWLQTQLIERFGISSSIEKNTRADYDGYGLNLNIDSTKTQKESTKEKDKQSKESKKERLLKEAQEALKAKRPSLTRINTLLARRALLVLRIPDIEKREALTSWVANLFSDYLELLLDNIQNNYQLVNDEDLNEDELETKRAIFKGTRELLKKELIDRVGIPNEEESLDSIPDFIFNLIYQLVNEIPNLYYDSEGNAKTSKEDAENLKQWVKDNIVDITDELLPVYYHNPLSINFLYYYEDYKLRKDNPIDKGIKYIQIIALNLYQLLDVDLFDALCQNTKDYLRNRENLNINFLNTNTENTSKDLENDDDEGSTDTRSGLQLIKYKLLEPSSTMSTRIRKLLGSAYSRTKYGHYRYNKLLLRIRVNPDIAYYTLVLEFAKMNKPEDFDRIANNIELKYPWFSDIRDKLYEDDDIRNEFYSAFRNVFTKYCTLNSDGTMALLNYEASIDTFMDNMTRSYEGGLVFGSKQIFDANSLCVLENVKAMANSFGLNKNAKGSRTLAFISALMDALLSLYKELKKDPTKLLSNSDSEKLKNILKAIVELNKKHENNIPYSYSLEGLLNNLGIDTANLDLTALIPEITEDNIRENVDTLEEARDSLWYKEDDEGNLVKKSATELLKELMGDALTLPIISLLSLNRVISIFNAAKSIVAPGPSGSNKTETWAFKPGDNLLSTKRKAYLSIGYALSLTTEAFTSVSFRHLDITRPSYAAADKISEIFNTISNIDFNNTLEVEESILYLENNFGKYDWFRNQRTGKWYSPLLGKIYNSLLVLKGEEVDLEEYGGILDQDLLKNITYFNVLTVGGNDRERDAVGKVDKKTLLHTLIKSFFARPNTKGLKWGLILNPLFSDVDAMILFQVPRYDTILKQVDIERLLLEINLGSLEYLSEIIENLVPEEIISNICTLIEQESNRVAYFRSKNKVAEGFETRARKFHNFPILNEIEDFFTQLSNSSNREEFFRGVAVEYLSYELTKFLSLFKENEIVSFGREIEALKTNNAKASKTDEVAESDESLIEKANKELHEKEVKKTNEEKRKESEEVFLNNLLAGILSLITYHTNYINSFTLIKSILNGDPANYKNYLDEVKRGKQSYSGGRRLYALNLDGTRMTETCMYVLGVKTPPNRLKELEKLLDSDTRVLGVEKALMKALILKFYSEIDSTDGFSLRSLSSIRKIYKALGGTWTNSMEESYSRIVNGECTGEDVLNIWNQIKPFLFSHTDKTYTIKGNNRTEKVITQHKNSEYMMTALYSLLNTALNKSPLLRGMHKFMNEHNIDVIHFDSVVKVGYNKSEAFSVEEVLNSSDEEEVFNHLELLLGKTLAAKTKKAKEMFKTFPLNDYLIMQPSDDHLIDLIVIFGSQLRNIIPADLPEDFTMTIKSKDGSSITLNREESIKYYNMLIADLLLDSFREISNKFTDLKSLLAFFLEAMEGNPKYGDDVKMALSLNEDGTGFRIPFNSPNLKNKIEEIILGVFKNNIQRQKINGGSVVLVSNIGVSDDLHVKYSKDGKTVRYLEAYMPAYMGDIYKDFLVKLVDNNGIEYWTINFDEVKEHMDKSLLDIIGYRIPTEDKYSIMPIRIKGFLPAAAGTSIILPTEIIARSGTDFDIDKLFLMIKNCKRIDFLGSAVAKGLRRFLNNHKDEYEGTDEAKKKYEKELKEVRWLINNAPEDFFDRVERNSILEDFWNNAIEKGEASQYYLDKPYFKELKGDIVKGEGSKIDILETSKLSSLKGKTRKKVRDNMIMDVIWSIMTSHTGSLISSEYGNFDNIKLAAKQQLLIKSLYEILRDLAEKKGINVVAYLKSLSSKELDNLLDSTSVDPLSPNTWADTFENLMMGNDLIGMCAVNSSNHYKYLFLNLYVKYKEGKDTFPLKFMTTKRDENGKEVLKTIYLKDIDSKYSPINGRRIGSMFAQYQAASPDNGKDPCLGHINASAKTINRIRLLTAFGIDEVDVGFLNTIDDYISILKISLLKKNKHLDANTAAQFNGDIDTAISNIYEFFSNPEGKSIEGFAPFVAWYLLIDDMAQLLAKGSVISRSDSTNGALPISLAEAILLRLKVLDFMAKAKDELCVIGNLDKLIDINLNATTKDLDLLRQEFFNSPIPRLLAVYTFGIESALNLVRDFLPLGSDTVFETIKELAKISKKTLLSKKDLNIIKRFLDELTTFILSKSTIFGDEKEGATMLEKRNYYIYNFPIKLKNYLEAKQRGKTGIYYTNSLARKYNIIRLLHINNKGITYERIGKLSLLMRLHYSEELEAMISDPELSDLIKELAYDLFMYSYYDKGLNFTHNSYGIFFNTPFLETIEGFIDDLRNNTNLVVNSTNLLSRYLRQFMLNNPELIPLVSDTNYTIDSDGVLTITSNEINTKEGSPYYYSNGLNLLLPFIKIKYKNGFMYFMKSNDLSKTYTKISVNKPFMVTSVTGSSVNSQRTPYYNANEDDVLDFKELKGRGPTIKVPNSTQVLNVPEDSREPNIVNDSDVLSTEPSLVKNSIDNIDNGESFDTQGLLTPDEVSDTIYEPPQILSDVTQDIGNKTSNNEMEIERQIAEVARFTLIPDDIRYERNWVSTSSAINSKKVEEAEPNNVKQNLDSLDIDKNAVADLAETLCK